MKYQKDSTLWKLGEMRKTEYSGYPMIHIVKSCSGIYKVMILRKTEYSKGWFVAFDGKSLKAAREYAKNF